MDFEKYENEATIRLVDLCDGNSAMIALGYADNVVGKAIKNIKADYEFRVCDNCKSRNFAYKRWACNYLELAEEIDGVTLTTCSNFEKKD